MDNKKLIFFLSHFNGGGAELVSILLANWMADYKGISVEFLMLDDSGPLKQSLSKKISINKLNQKVDKNKILNCIQILSNIFKLRKDNSELIICSEGLPWIYGFSHPKTIVWIHADLEAYFSELGWFKNYVLRLALSKYKRLVFVSYSSMESYEYLFKKQIGTFFKKVIYNPIRYEVLPVEKTITTNKVKLVSIGRLEKIKCHDLTIKLIYELRLLGFDIELSIYGDGGEYVNLKDFIKKLNMENFIKLHGYVPDLNKELSISDIFISCSESEGYGVSMLEAMAFGIPSLYLSPCKGLDEISSDGKYAIAVPRHCHLKMLNEITNLISSYSTYKKYSKLSILRARELTKINFYQEWHDLLISI
jgi:glycosyltransferase involved in cell wall biosynthesis